MSYPARTFPDDEAAVQHLRSLISDLSAEDRERYGIADMSDGEIINVARFARSAVGTVDNFGLLYVRFDYWEGGMAHWNNSKSLPGVNITSNTDRTPRINPFGTKAEHSHTQFLYAMWENVDGGNIIIVPESWYVNSLLSLSKQKLELICRMIIPTPLIEQLSPTHAASLYALLTGIVVTRKDDPTLDTELWEKIIKCDRSMIFQTGVSVAKAHKKENIFTERYSNAYSQLYNPHIRTIFDNMVTISMLNIGKMNGMQLFVTYKDDIESLFKAVGSDKRLYDDPDINNAIRDPGRRLEKALISSFNETIPYFVRQGYNVNSPRQPLRLNDMEDVHGDDLFNVMGAYTDIEIQEFYLPHFFNDRELFIHNGIVFNTGAKHFDDRKDFILVTLTNYEPDSFVWTIANPNTCDNDSKLDVESGSLRGQTRKEDVEGGIIDEDPNLVYMARVMGARRRCFRMSELIKSFQETQHGFEYLDPDWIPADVASGPEDLINPLTGGLIERTFPTYIIVQLYSYLKDKLREAQRFGFRISNNHIALLEKIKLGIKELNEVQDFVNNQITTVNAHPEWRNDMLIYFSWLFLFSMWIRFWKGPGTPYPVVWNEMSSETCEYQQRDQHINIELSVHGNLLEVIERNRPELAEFLKKLPFMYYTWSTGEINKPSEAISRRIMGVYTVQEIINKVQLDSFCMAQASDILSGTAFVYLTEILGVPRDRLSSLLVHVMVLLRQYENFSISSRASVIAASSMNPQSKELALEVISQHRGMLNAGTSGFNQPDLDIARISPTRHLPQGFGELIAMQ